MASNNAVKQWNPVFAVPAQDAAAVVPSDSTPLSGQVSAFFVGTGGSVVVVTAAGSTVTFANVPSGTTVPLAISQVKATGTTATGIVALY